MNSFFSTDTWICLSVIAVAFAFCFIYVFRYKNSDKLMANRRIVIISLHWFPHLVYWVHLWELLKA